MYRTVARWLIVLFTLMTLQMPLAQASMVGTPQLISPDESRAKVEAFLQRQEVTDQLTALGVDPASAQERVAAMSDEEAARVATEIDKLPAGGSDIVGALVFIFLVLLITDLLGLTDVFPFVKKHGHR